MNGGRNALPRIFLQTEAIELLPLSCSTKTLGVKQIREVFACGLEFVMGELQAMFCIREDLACTASLCVDVTEEEFSMKTEKGRKDSTRSGIGTASFYAKYFQPRQKLFPEYQIGRNEGVGEIRCHIEHFS